MLNFQIAKFKLFMFEAYTFLRIHDKTTEFQQLNKSLEM
jgi:hypothetical protein